MDEVRARLRKLNTQRLTREAKWLALGWALIALGPLWIAGSSFQERSIRSAIVANGTLVTAVVTAHQFFGTKCVMHFTYYWKRSYDGTYRVCSEPVGKAFTVLIDPADPKTAIPKARAPALERVEFWAIAIFGGFAILVSIAVLPYLCLLLFEIAKRAWRRTAARKRAT